MTNALHDSLLDCNIKHDYVVRQGGHKNAYWSNSILYHPLLLSENFKNKNHII